MNKKKIILAIVALAIIFGGVSVVWHLGKQKVLEGIEKGPKYLKEKEEILLAVGPASVSGYPFKLKAESPFVDIEVPLSTGGIAKGVFRLKLAEPELSASIFSPLQWTVHVKNAVGSLSAEGKDVLQGKAKSLSFDVNYSEADGIVFEKVKAKDAVVQLDENRDLLKMDKVSYDMKVKTISSSTNKLIGELEIKDLDLAEEYKKQFKFPKIDKIELKDKITTPHRNHQDFKEDSEAFMKNLISDITIRCQNEHPNFPPLQDFLTKVERVNGRYEFSMEMKIGDFKCSADFEIYMKDMKPEGYLEVKVKFLDDLLKKLTEIGFIKEEERANVPNLLLAFLKKSDDGVYATKFEVRDGALFKDGAKDTPIWTFPKGPINYDNLPLTKPVCQFVTGKR